MLVYAVNEETGKRKLIEIRCDGAGCDASIKPGPEIVTSGWERRGTVDVATWRIVTEVDLCPRCA